jgi:hypothetical protein
MADPSGNVLFYGDNLDVLRRYIPDESVDLIYLDPPFNSNANYSVLFGHADGTKSAAQVKAFDDTWTWDTAAAAAFQDAVVSGGDVAQALAAFQTLLGPSTMLAYLSMMAPRLVELRRVLKQTGSLCSALLSLARFLEHETPIVADGLDVEFLDAQHEDILKWNHAGREVHFREPTGTDPYLRANVKMRRANPACTGGMPVARHRRVDLAR